MAKVVTVTQYEAVDGSLFLSEAECNAHEFKLENGARIEAAAEAFLNTTKAIDRSRNMQGNVIANFLAFYLPWVEAGSPAVERTVFDTPKAEKVEGAEGEAAAPAVAEVAADGTEEQPMF
ncbi:hypothetical protein PM1_019 [Pectobacterium phage PM1]|uniref:Uncharacterized protein n=1 Tax=Pectobacterium phage PM1 TaxID=1399915 RepID=X2CSW4_9CAUD|nr:hypothetical protein PM1_019 [Pectobacterium phage PM1]AGV99235.1 hypothetical protein PM1_019 [Pectobacterium phage PM1]